jgi:Zn-finger nucleic acid-binding protein
MVSAFAARQRLVLGQVKVAEKSNEIIAIPKLLRMTILRELVTLRAALRFAQTEKWIADVRYIEVPSQPKPRDLWLTRAEADRLLAESQALHVKTFLAVPIHGGTRDGGPSAHLEPGRSRRRPDRLRHRGGREGEGRGADRGQPEAISVGSPYRGDLPLRHRARQQAGRQR